MTWLLDLRLGSEQVVAVVLISAVVGGLAAHAVQWYRALGRACVLSRDPVIGRDQHRPERQAILSAVQADQRQRLNSVVNIGRRS